MTLKEMGHWYHHRQLNAIWNHEMNHLKADQSH